MNEQRVWTLFIAALVQLETLRTTTSCPDRLKWSVRWIKSWLTAELEKEWSVFRRSAGGQSLGACSVFSYFINYLDGRGVSKLEQVFRWKVVCCPSEEPQGTREMGWQEPCEVQQWECKVLFLCNNSLLQCRQGDNWLERSFEESALEALRNTILLMSQKYIYILTRKITIVLGCIGKSFVIMLMEIILIFYLSLVRNLECCAFFWLSSTNETWTYCPNSSEESQRY